MFALGEVSNDFLCANLGARVLALRKPNGKLRPIACGSVLRRLAARAVCATLKEDIRKACGELQFAVGRRAGCEQVHKALAALTAASPSAVVLQFDCSNAFNTMPRQRIVDAVVARLPALAPVVCNWLTQTTTHLFWDEGRVGKPITATMGVDQGCPLSPALFAIGLADTLERIRGRLAGLSADCKVFSYLDDVMVVAPSGCAEQATQVVCEELQQAGLVVNAGKTAAWTRDPQVQLPPALQRLRVDKCRVLGALAPWLDPEGDFSRLEVHGVTDGEKVVQSARDFADKLQGLRAAGLTRRTAFLLLQSFSQGHVTHLLRANYESAGWCKRFDDILLESLAQVTGNQLDDSQRQQAFTRLADGGLGLGSAELAAESAYLGSWALVLKEAAAKVGVSSWADFQTRCPTLADTMALAETKMLADAAGSLQPIYWVGLLQEPRGKMQSFWFHKLQDQRKATLLRSLSDDDKVDFRSYGGPGAGGFLQPPVPFEDEEAPVPMPDRHFQVALQDRLRMPLCTPGARCQHRRCDGTLCNEPLDLRGKHAKKCEVGPCRTGRHDELKHFTAAFHHKVTGYVAVKEQRVSAWDRLNPRTGLQEEAVLDVSTRDAASGRKIFVDVTVTCAHSGYQPTQRARAHKDGAAAAQAVSGKRQRYPPSGGELVPLAFEDGGRPAEETAAFVRSWGLLLPPEERSEVIRHAWQQYSSILQAGNAEMILSALG